ncbi:MAG: trehalose 6-phosphate synthase [Thermodesulfobacteriota bacterium]|nr:trehalose 6-phosphate synthase [Thermodesulfobacteriota bacterium]
MIKKQTVDSLKTFYDLMTWTRNIRYQVVNQLFLSQDFQEKQVDALKTALGALESCLKADYRATLKIGGSDTIDVDLTYEITELKKDIYYLENGEDKFISYLESLHSDFSSHVQSGVAVLRGKQFNCFITDRDGTTNNYCGRYRSSIQSIYNALFLARFAKNCVANPIMITSAPLRDIGITDVSTIPEKTIVFAASKGREFIDLSGTRRSFPIEDQKQALISRLNHQLSKLVQAPTYEIFSLIGSGLQFKFGQTTIARQDISGSIEATESDAFLALIKDIVKKIDPAEENFRIEDTGLDIEIILTVSDQKAGLKDFDKADAIDYLDKELNLHMEKGPNLICGDTGSDIPMLETAMARTNDSGSIFVTKKPELADRVKAVCPDAVTVPEPDMLVTILNQLSLYPS